jgi:WD40 repeat protein
LPGLTEKVTAIALSPDGRFAAGGEFAGVGLLGDVGTAKELARVPRRRQGDEGQGRVHGQMLARSREGGDVLLLSLPDLRWSRVQSHRRSLTGLVFLDNDTLVSSSIDGSVGRWSIPTSFRWDQPEPSSGNSPRSRIAGGPHRLSGGLKHSVRIA